MEHNGQKRKEIEEFKFIEDIQSDNNSISSTNICKTTIFRIHIRMSMNNRNLCFIKSEQTSLLS